MKFIIALMFWPYFSYGKDLTISIFYSNGKPDKIIQSGYTPGQSALEVLQQVSRIQTSQTGSYLFVRSIDGVQSQIGKFGWFYLIDNQKVNTTAQNYILEDAHTMTWYYGVEACY